MNKNLVLGQAFKFLAQILLKLEVNTEDWHLAPIWGHLVKNNRLPFYTADIATLQVHQMNTVSQIFDTHLRGA
jgi:hypothetical protein